MNVLRALVFIIFLAPECTSGQSLLPDFLELDYHTGYLVKNYPTFPERLNRPYGIALHAGIRLAGTKFWHRYYRYPEFSIQAGYGNLGNKKVLGDFCYAIPELAFTQHTGPKFYVKERLGLGLAYFTKPYDPESNPTNTLVGSHITFMPGAKIGRAHV